MKNPKQNLLKTPVIALVLMALVAISCSENEKNGVV